MLSSIYARKRLNEDGFTLIELLIVIIGLLAAIALPIFIDQQKVAIDASVKSDVRNTVTNITNAQAQGVTSARAAISRDGTTIAVKDLTDSTKSVSVKRTSSMTDTTLATIPTLGDSYTVQGSNAGGKIYQGLDSTTSAKAFTFTSASGKFADADAVSATAVTVFSWDMEGALPAGVTDETIDSYGRVKSVGEEHVPSAHSGTKVYVSAYNVNAQVPRLLLPAGYFKPGQTYTVSAWVRRNELSNDETEALATSTRGGSYEFNTKNFTATSTWQQVSMKYTAPTDTVYPVAILVQVGGSNGGSTLIDDITVSQD